MGEGGIDETGYFSSASTAVVVAYILQSASASAVIQTNAKCLCGLDVNLLGTFAVSMSGTGIAAAGQIYTLMDASVEHRLVSYVYAA